MEEDRVRLLKSSPAQLRHQSSHLLQPFDLFGSVLQWKMMFIGSGFGSSTIQNPFLGGSEGVHHFFSNIFKNYGNFHFVFIFEKYKYI